MSAASHSSHCVLCRQPSSVVAQATQDKVQALMRLSDSERSKQRISNQADTLKKQNQELSSRLSQATQEKVNALMRVAADGNSSQAAANAKGMPSPGKSSTWKVQQFTTC